MDIGCPKNPEFSRTDIGFGEGPDACEGVGSDPWNGGPKDSGVVYLKRKPTNK